MAERGGKQSGGKASGGALGARAASPPRAPVKPPAHGSHHGQGGHASTGFYWLIGLVLAIITAVEVAVFYIPALHPVLVPVLLVLSAAKFVLVVMFFMHLRFDSMVLTGLFMAGVVLASFMIVSLIVLYHFLPLLER